MGQAIGNKFKNKENGINTIYSCFKRNIRLAYVRLGSAHNLVYSPALVSAPRPAVILARQQIINLKMEKSVKSINSICFKKNEASLCKIRLGT